jgi:hypothetical protein
MTKLYVFEAFFSDGRESFYDAVVGKDHDDAEDRATAIVKGIDDVGHGCDENAYVNILGALASSPESIAEDIAIGTPNEAAFME